MRGRILPGKVFPDGENIAYLITPKIKLNSINLKKNNQERKKTYPLVGVAIALSIGWFIHIRIYWSKKRDRWDSIGEPGMEREDHSMIDRFPSVGRL